MKQTYDTNLVEDFWFLQQMQLGRRLRIIHKRERLYKIWRWFLDFRGFSFSQNINQTKIRNDAYKFIQDVYKKFWLKTKRWSKHMIQILYEDFWFLYQMQLGRCLGILLIIQQSPDGLIARFTVKP